MDSNLLMATAARGWYLFHIWPRPSLPNSFLLGLDPISSVVRNSNDVRTKARWLRNELGLAGRVHWPQAWSAGLGSSASCNDLIAQQCQSCWWPRGLDGSYCGLSTGASSADPPVKWSKCFEAQGLAEGTSPLWNLLFFFVLASWQNCLKVHSCICFW